MKIEIPFDESIFKEQMLFLFDNAYDKHLHTNKITFYYGLFFLLVSCVSYFQLNPDSIFYIVGLIVGSILLGISLLYYKEYKTKKKLYFSLIEKEVQEHLHSDTVSVFHYNEEFIRWENFKIDFKITWQGIKFFELKDEYIIIGIADKTPLLILSKTDVQDHFDEILIIAKTKGLI